MIINTNIMALNAYKNLQNTQTDLTSSLEKLSSGYRINKASDDASGLVISEGLKSQVSGLQQATNNAQNGISVVQTAEGALASVQSMLQRMRDLVIESANTGANDTTARQAAQNEIVQLRNEIDQVANTTSFGNEQLLNGSFGAQAARLSNVTTGLVGGAVGQLRGYDVRACCRLRRGRELERDRDGHDRHVHHCCFVPGRAPEGRQRRRPRQSPASPARSRSTCATSAAAPGRSSSCATRTPPAPR